MLAQITTTNEVDTATAAGIAGAVVFFWILAMAVAILSIVGLWKMFDKAGEPGWAAIIPIYNMVVLLKISGFHPALVLLLFVPLANLVLMIMACFNLAPRFGKGPGTAIGLLLLGPIFYLILGFGSATYVGPKWQG